MSHITAYYQLQKLPEEIKEDFKIRSKARLDCIAHYNLFDNEPLSQFVNKKGMMFFFCSAPENYIIANAKRIADIGLLDCSLASAKSMKSHTLQPIELISLL